MKTATVSSNHTTPVVSSSFNTAPLMTEDYNGESSSITDVNNVGTSSFNGSGSPSMSDDQMLLFKENTTPNSNGFTPIRDDSSSPIENSQINNNNNNHCNHSNNKSIPSSPSKSSSPVQNLEAPNPQQLLNSAILNLKDVHLAPELCELFSCFRRYKAAISGKREDELTKYQALVNELFERDYHVSYINNKNGELCATYPPELVVIEAEKEQKCKGCVERDAKPINNSQAIQKILSSSRFARVRTRFPFPVIFYHNKNLCRSSTLSKKIEYMFQTGVNSMKKQFGNNGATMEESENGDTQNMENLRNNDISAIKHLSVKYICDLMVENKKKKFGFFVCSSEKADMHDRYTKQFVIASTPYPGVEFFSLFNQNRHNAKDLFYGWDFTEYPAELKIDKNNVPVIWEQYKSWDLLNLTQNYLKLLLEYISDDSKDSGVLVHCISGWDRTPLFISLLRLSLWADGEIHQTLNSSEILYLTVAYDWFLFSHQLADRAGRGEDIFYFCFYFLEFITSNDYSIHSYAHLVRNNDNDINSNIGNSSINNNNNNVNSQNQNGNSCNGFSSNINHEFKRTNPSPSVVTTGFTKESRSNSNDNRMNSFGSFSKQPIRSPGSMMYPSYGKGISPLVQDTQSAPPTPKKNSPSSSALKFPTFISNYTSAPSTPVSHSPMTGSMIMGEHRMSPNLSSTGPVDVPRHHSTSNTINNKDAEELGGSWQLMGSFQGMKSLSSFGGSTPKFMHPSHHSFSSNSEIEENDETNSKTVSDDDEELSSSDLDGSWDPPFVLETDSNVGSGGSSGCNKRIKQDGFNGLRSNSNNCTNNNNNNNDKLPRKEQHKEHHYHNHHNNNNSSNNNNNNNNNNNHHSHSNNNHQQQSYTHSHSNNGHLTREELEDRRRERLMEVKSLFITLYQQCCLETNDSYWKTILTYLPKFG